VLAQLDKVEGVGRSYANHTGNMVRVSLNTAADPEKVAEQVAKILTADKRNPTRLMRDEFTHALDKEQWREGERVGELSAIEFRTLGLRQLKTFAEIEKLDEKTTRGSSRSPARNGTGSPKRLRPRTRSSRVRLIGGLVVTASWLH